MLTYVQRFVVGAITQGLLYGIYLATLIQFFRWFIFTDEGWKPREKIRSFILALGTFIFLMTTINVMTTLAYKMEFVGSESYDDEPKLHRLGVAIGINTSELLAILSIDSVLIYRCWIVYGKSWRVVCAPVTFWLASLACSALFSFYVGVDIEGQTSFNIPNEQKATIGLYVCNIAISVYTTTAIIYRIWSTTKTTGSGGAPKRSNYIMRILAESGILYTSMTVFGLVGSVLTSGNNPTGISYLIFDIADGINFSMAGISFNLLYIRVNQGRVELRSLWDTLADSRNVDGVRTLSGIQFNNPQITAPSEGPSSNAANARPVDEVIDEIQEQRRSNDEMKVN